MPYASPIFDVAPPARRRVRQGIVKKGTIVVVSLAAAVAALALTAGLACSSMRTTWAVRSFARNAGGKAAQYYAPDVKKGDRLADSLRDLLAARPGDGAALQAVYEADHYQFRFVVEQKTTAEHRALHEWLAKEIFAHGVDVEPFQLEKINGDERALDESLKTIASLHDASLTAPESQALIDAMKSAGAEDVSPAGIFNFVGRPANEGKFPNLQELVAKLRAAAEARDNAILSIESGDAANLHRLLAEMGMKAAEWPTFWNDSKGNLAGVIKPLIPVTPVYAALFKELARYREMAKQPAPPRLNNPAKRGATGEYVAQIQRRLQLEGFWGGPINGVYDAALEDAVKIYQDDHQVVSDGKVEKVTLERMNVPIPERVKQLKLALHKLRQSDSRGEDYFVRVNIGAQELEVYTDGGTKLARKHRIVVGSQMEKNHTPLFSAAITDFIFYPAWHVPQRIIKDEMMRDYEKDPEYFDKHNYEVKMQYNKDGSLDKIISVTEPPGPGNALGVVKINFPNKYDVYLHDTNLKQLFSRSLRTFSHGCMRVHKPVELVRWMLERDKNEFASKVDETLQHQRSIPVELHTKVPIHIEYVTVGVNEQGKAVFNTDPYNMDIEALAQISPE
jgi:murein L,D-transpeptidase YcbB/YkuD